MRTIRKVRLKGGDTSSELLNERISRINSEIVVLESYIKSGHEKYIKAGKNKLLQSRREAPSQSGKMTDWGQKNALRG